MVSYIFSRTVLFFIEMKMVHLFHWFYNCNCKRTHFPFSHSIHSNFTHFYQFICEMHMLLFRTMLFDVYHCGENGAHTPHDVCTYDRHTEIDTRWSQPYWIENEWNSLGISRDGTEWGQQIMKYLRNSKQRISASFIIQLKTDGAWKMSTQFIPQCSLLHHKILSIVFLLLLVSTQFYIYGVGHCTPQSNPVGCFSFGRNLRIHLLT